MSIFRRNDAARAEAMARLEAKNRDYRADIRAMRERLATAQASIDAVLEWRRNVIELTGELLGRVERLEDNAPIHITGNTEDAQRAIASLVSQLDDAKADIRRLTAQGNAA
ncbi:MAG: hypothetical protein EOO27_06320 [Comamonadaceae bacterium]|nr:MAG: hypothetical protein EOO27_06320 [Comamonadaceae bacterium]